MGGKAAVVAAAWCGAAVWAVSVLGVVAAARGQGRKYGRGRDPVPRELLEEFRDRCRSMNVERDTGASEYYVYGWQDMEWRREPKRGIASQPFGVTRVCVFDSEEKLGRARKAYGKLRRAFHEFGGDTRYREFPFGDRSWGFGDFEGAAGKARELRRKSRMAYWPGVLELAVGRSTGAKEYFVFGYREIRVRVSFDESDPGEDAADVTYLASRGKARVVIFDDAEVAGAARARYGEYVARWADVNDGRGQRVGRMEAVVEGYDAFGDARRRAEELGRR